MALVTMIRPELASTTAWSWAEFGAGGRPRVRLLPVGQDVHERLVGVGLTSAARTSDPAAGGPGRHHRQDSREASARAAG